LVPPDLESALWDHRAANARFLLFGPSSLDVEISAYVLANNWNQFLEIQETFLLRAMECIESNGVQMALPSTIVVTAASTSPEPKGDGLLTASTPDKKASGQTAVTTHEEFLSAAALGGVPNDRTR
jgi:hypothetical protein